MNLSSLVSDLCGSGDEQLFRCARCQKAVYCSNLHQKEHWKNHKSLCLNVVDHCEGESERNVAIVEDSCLKEVGKISMNISEGSALVDEAVERFLDDVELTECNPLKMQGYLCEAQYKQEKFNGAHQYSSLFQGLASGSETSDGLVEKDKQLTETIVDMGSVALDSERIMRPETAWLPSPTENLSVTTAAINPPFLHRSFSRGDLSSEELRRKSSIEWMAQMCQYVVRDLEKYGICVVDNFMGKERAESIHRTVVSMYHSGVFVEGETVSSSLETTRNIRGDKIAWVDGTEKNCTDFAYFISTVDAVIMNSIRMKGNGQLGQRVIGGRTKAMIACYPGSGSHYVKHVDNPNRDGRCITSTYYVNKDWDAKTVGGLLRIFPQGWANQVVDIEPVLDRMVFFWSDRRNPHEVQPSFRTRYAITVWYFDAKEREEARLRYKMECAIKNKKSAKE